MKTGAEGGVDGGGSCARCRADGREHAGLDTGRRDEISKHGEVRAAVDGQAARDGSSQIDRRKRQAAFHGRLVDGIGGFGDQRFSVLRDEIH